MANDYMQAKETYWTELDGEPVCVQRGEYIRAGHDLIVANPEKFEPLAVSSRWDVVEQATAAPGERRNTGRPKSAAKAAVSREKEQEDG